MAVIGREAVDRVAIDFGAVRNSPGCGRICGAGLRAAAPSASWRGQTQSERESSRKGAKPQRM